MKGAAVAALALVGGGLLAHLLLADPGHVALRVGRQLFETTIPVFVLMLVGLYLLLRGFAADFAPTPRRASGRAASPSRARGNATGATRPCGRQLEAL